jgi:hypothetical protein
VLELRHGPRRDALAAARPLFEELGHLFAGREIVVVPGNHDHALISPWLLRRGELELPPPPLEAEQLLSAGEASPALARLADWARPAELVVAYPGLWLRSDVYATHGHYLDCHLTVPTFERLAIGAMMRLLRRPASGFAGPDDYEAATAPLFAWIDSVAQQRRTGGTLNGQVTVRAWQALRGGRHRRTWRDRLFAGAFPIGVAALNRAGLGPVRPGISRGELRRAGLDAMGEVVARLRIGASHIIFGHTHRAGPLDGDVGAEWVTRSGAALINAGCWTYDGYFLTAKPGESPYWPGGCVTIDDDGPPRLTRLLEDRSRADLAPHSVAQPA